MLDNEVDLVIFSKDRPFQLKSLLLSVLSRLNGIRSISVLYSASSSQMKDRYSLLISDDFFNNISFIHESRSFKKDLNGVLKSLRAEYVMFAVDDMLVFGEVNFSDVLPALEDDSIFSLRLGANITYSYTLECDQVFPVLSYDAPNNDEYVFWKIKDAEHDFSYPMSVDMHVIPLFLIRRLSNFLFFYAPNTYEGALNKISYFIRDWKMMSFKISKCVNLPINKVQGENENRSENGDPSDLADHFDQGLCFDYTLIDGSEINSPHQILELETIKCSNLLGIK